jgi:hypothetical protein
MAAVLVVVWRLSAIGYRIFGYETRRESIFGDFAPCA